VVDIESRLRDVTLHSLAYGPGDGPLALCLHGFPDTAHTFRHLAPRLADLGYRVVVPYMRGYAPSSTSSTHNYQTAALAKDASDLHEVLGGDERAVIIGHDWGAAATYLATGAEPNRWRRAVTLAIPPPAVMARSLGSYDQLRSSWYMFFFQNPMAEGVVRHERFDFLSRLWEDWSPGYQANVDLGLLRESLRGEENLSAVLGYYRALFDGSGPIDPSSAIFRDAAFETNAVATLYLHGELDGCVRTSSLADPLAYLAPGSRFEVVPGAGHFLHLERPSEVNQSIERFLA